MIQREYICTYIERKNENCEYSFKESLDVHTEIRRDKNLRFLSTITKEREGSRYTDDCFS